MVVSAQQLFKTPILNLIDIHILRYYSYDRYDLSGQLALSVQSINDILETSSATGSAGQKSSVGRSCGDKRRKNGPAET